MPQTSFGTLGTSWYNINVLRQNIWHTTNIYIYIILLYYIYKSKTFSKNTDTNTHVKSYICESVIYLCSKKLCIHNFHQFHNGIIWLVQKKNNCIHLLGPFTIGKMGPSELLICCSLSTKQILTQPMDPEIKSLNFIFPTKHVPTKHVIPESLKFSHWLSEDMKLSSNLSTQPVLLGQANRHLRRQRCNRGRST